MVTHLSIIHGLGCFTSMIWLFTLTILNVASCFYCAVLRYLTWESFYPLEGKKTKFSAHSLKWLTSAQYKQDPKGKAVRVNSQITEVRQPRQ